MNFIRTKLSKSFLLGVIFLISTGWGFFGHENINRLAVYTLPPEMISFYKKNISYIVEASVYPDMRRYAVPEEGPRHYIDMDEHADSIPQRWNDAVEKFGKDSLMLHGIVPWHTYRVYLQLRNAFMVHDVQRVLRLSAELGHYVADAHVPLHTTSNHNGQKTDQHGIHGLWESRLPELFSGNYDFFVGRAVYIDDVQKVMWNVVRESHACVDSVLSFERELSKKELHRKYSFETRAKQTVKVYSERYSKLYHTMLRGMVERRMRNSIRMVGNLWYSAWVDAGQPDLKSFQYKRAEAEMDSVKTWTASEH